MWGHPWGYSGFINIGDQVPGVLESLILLQTSVKQASEGPMVGCSVRSFGIKLLQIQGVQLMECVEKEFSRVTQSFTWWWVCQSIIHCR